MTGSGKILLGVTASKSVDSAGSGRTACVPYHITECRICQRKAGGGIREAAGRRNTGDGGGGMVGDGEGGRCWRREKEGNPGDRGRREILATGEDAGGGCGKEPAFLTHRRDRWGNGSPGSPGRGRPRPAAPGPASAAPRRRRCGAAAGQRPWPWRT